MTIWVILNMLAGAGLLGVALLFVACAVVAGVGLGIVERLLWY